MSGSHIDIICRVGSSGNTLQLGVDNSGYVGIVEDKSRARVCTESAVSEPPARPAIWVSPKPETVETLDLKARSSCDIPKTRT